MLAHDLQTPLTAIILTAAELRRTGDAHQRRAAARMLTCAERMKCLTVDLLQFARLRSLGALPVHPEEVDLAELAVEAVREVEECHPGSQVRLCVGGDVKGEWDPGRIAQVLVNLVCNAVQHGERAAPVTIHLTRLENSVHVDVVNHGQPIPESEIPKLFEPFAHGGRSSSSGQDSAGLGLFIVAEIVSAHGGEVVAFNCREAGTVTFSVRLPLRSAARE
jgi:signal transduction histidine kinase